MPPSWNFPNEVPGTPFWGLDWSNNEQPAQKIILLHYRVEKLEQLQTELQDRVEKLEKLQDRVEKLEEEVFNITINKW